ncbi:hypothetical protein [Anaerococcus cruorum]|uniref:Apea-like HEPN domain-containing protein n=1 Tax=Anaerococcus cruorum TaxID=3115617 RepID=A0ABW9MUT6_9FIRM
MYLECILLPKDNDKVKSITPAEQVLSKNDFVKDFSKKYKECKLTVAYHKEPLDHLLEINIKADGPIDKQETILNEIKKIIKKSSDFNDFYIVFSYDGVSDYYCKVLYPKLIYIERSIRNIIYVGVVNNYGNMWIERFIHQIDKEHKKNIMSNIKKNGKKEWSLENALEFVYFSDFRNLLFRNYPYFNNNGEQKVCFWNRYINTDETNFVEEKFQEIIEIRNIVMHGKEMNQDIYQNSNKVIEDFIDIVKKAERKIIKDEISPLINNETKDMKNRFYAKNVGGELIITSMSNEFLGEDYEEN